MDYDLFYAWVVFISCVIPYFLVCRLLWYVGTWFKRHSRLDYPKEE